MGGVSVLGHTQAVTVDLLVISFIEDLKALVGLAFPKATDQIFVGDNSRRHIH